MNAPEKIKIILLERAEEIKAHDTTGLPLEQKIPDIIELGVIIVIMILLCFMQDASGAFKEKTGEHSQ